MQVKANNKTLLNGLKAVAGVVDSGGADNIGTHCLLDASEGDGLRISTAFMGVMLSTRIECTIEKPGAATAAAATLTKAVASFGATAPVVLTTTGKGGTLTIGDGGDKLELPSMAAAAYPVLDLGGDDDENVAFRMEAETLGTMLASVFPCAAEKEGRHYLNGVYFHAPAPRTKKCKQELLLVATDGLQLAISRMPCPQGAARLRGEHRGEHVSGEIIPRAAVVLLMKMLAQGGGGVFVEMSRRLARFSCGELTLTTNLVDGSFPDYARLFSKHKTNAGIDCDAEQLDAKLKRAMVVSEKSGSSLVFLAFDEQGLKATAGGKNGAYTGAMPVGLTGKPITIAANAMQLRSIIECIRGIGQGSDGNGFRLALDIKDDAAPLQLRREGNPSCLFLLMPLRAGGTGTGEADGEEGEADGEAEVDEDDSAAVAA